jgi:hypothetical protein
LGEIDAAFATFLQKKVDSVIIIAVELFRARRASARRPRPIRDRKILLAAPAAPQG